MSEEKGVYKFVDRSFRLIKSGPDGSDSTAPYNVELHREFTVSEFIDTVLKKYPGEWGYIGIYDGKSIFGNPNCEYKYGGVFIMGITPKYLSMKVKSARASGGWSRMDYILKVEED